jgi:hypothetical protein
MKRFLLVLAVVLVFVTPLLAQEPIKLSGAHFNLNLLGKADKCPGDDLVGSNRHTIMVLLKSSDKVEPNAILGDGDVMFADLDRTNKIFLAPGTDFQVVDGNACDKDGAKFTLPEDIATNWEIYARELGKPGGKGEITTCAVDPTTQEVVCSMTSVELERKAGRPLWKKVTYELTTIDYCILQAGGGCIAAQVKLFDDEFQNYFWDYDNNGLRLVQLRFYAKP